MGLSRAEIVLTGAALTPQHLKQWYRKLDINLREVFGATEACGAVTITPLGEISDVGVGKAIPGIDFKIVPESGEVIYKSEQLMIGYYKEPEKTAEILKDGWYYSGDKGFIDQEKNLNIIGRVKDAFKTDKGKYVTPNPIESEFSKNDLIEQVCVVGLSIPQPIALLNLSEIGMETKKEEVEAQFEDLLNKVNEKLSSFEKVSTMVIIKDPWTEANDLLTPTLKVKRNKIDERYMELYPSWEKDSSILIWKN